MSLDISFYSKSTTCECCGNTSGGEELHWQNITHNLNRMAVKAGFYDALWRGDESDIKNPKQLAEAIIPGLQHMIDNPAAYIPFNAENGWGTYDQFVPWLKELVEACKEFPDAEIHWSR